jgi:hypothetical protein
MVIATANKMIKIKNKNDKINRDTFLRQAKGSLSVWYGIGMEAIMLGFFFLKITKPFSVEREECRVTSLDGRLVVVNPPNHSWSWLYYTS